MLERLADERGPAHGKVFGSIEHTLRDLSHDLAARPTSRHRGRQKGYRGSSVVCRTAGPSAVRRPRSLAATQEVTSPHTCKHCHQGHCRLTRNSACAAITSAAAAAVGLPGRHPRVVPATAPTTCWAFAPTRLCRRAPLATEQAGGTPPARAKSSPAKPVKWDFT
ncbi:MAG: hypothetical protein U0797_17150 [Gemmataceae bacterium]